MSGEDWVRSGPEEAGFSAARLEEARRRLEQKSGDDPYRFLVVRDGKIVLEWHRGLASEEKVRIASAAKSVYSCVLGIVVAEGRLASVDEPVYNVYPEFMDVPEGEGPKAGRYAYAKDRRITFRQLIGNTSGYMKPGEEPGRVFNYQTYGMNILTHALASLYGYWDPDDPESCPGFAELIRTRIARPIGASFEYSLSNFDLHEKARLRIFGYYTQIHTDAWDAARLGWLWCSGGRWGQRQVVPADWLSEATKTSKELLKHAPEEQWCYGYGFWTNDHGKLWPNLPRTGFSANGAGGHFVSVFPEQALVAVQCPGPYEGPQTRANPEILEALLEAL